ncbi:GLPGLI family protein [Parapedobacter sp. ISTM3]|uniref:GLPGLI family protein n=1 Tax=Parapedobacter luteus TaxID=623280 RepID=A0A1T5ESK5_9SPHI|nr:MULTISPECIES: GLPGLI family protein [Parapedobacter]MBK1441533.1 GLPGLI family protein [Parapedobacter sp. ISTM3]SKB86917.1 GLPGLI family protein [Parapedobacter luteus]
MTIKNISFATILAGVSTFGHLFAVRAQESDVALAHVKYELVHIDDTNFRDNPRREDMMLYIGRRSAMYNSFTLASTLEKMKKEMESRQRADAAKAGAANGPSQSRFFVSSPNVSNETLYLFPQENNAFLTNRLGASTYIIPQEYPQIDWQIGDDVKEIGGYTCQQAIGTFGGREYTVWFAPELPFPYGPWKLNGLPGLILEAEDSRKEVIFRYAGFDKQGSGGIEIALPSDAATTTAKEFAKAKAAFDKNPMANALRNIEAPAGANVERKIVLKDQHGRELSPEEFNAMREMAMKAGKMKHPNNPLELHGDR